MSKKRKCWYCKRAKPDVARYRLFDNIQDAEDGMNGLYRYLCKRCEREEIAHP